MKKIFIHTIILLTLLGVYSCELDYYPSNAIEQTQAFETIKDAKSLRNMIYTQLRGRYNGAYLYAMDIQADFVNATNIYGNRNGSLYRWETYADDGTFSSIWANFYGALANINDFLDNVHRIKIDNTADQNTLNLYTSEVHLARAMYFHWLILRYAKDYEPSTAATDLGVPLTLKYDLNARPVRATVADVYTQILSDITEAKKGLITEGSQNAIYLTVDCIAALEAQVYLEMHQYDNAVTAANTLINSGRYPLISVQADLKSMWTNDKGSEIIFQPIMVDNTEAANGFSPYIGYNGSVYAPDYVPQQWVIDLFDNADIRRATYLRQRTITMNSGAVFNNIWLIDKYPGNPVLFTTANSNYCHMPKIFRIAEMYLIKAEALAWKGGADADALDALNALRTKRGLPALSGLVGDGLKEEIKNERTREMLCEGTRLYDLKRWKMGLTRSTPQNSNFVVLTPADQTVALTKDAGDNRFVWAIPFRDMQTNPNLVQNPGY